MAEETIDLALLEWSGADMMQARFTKSAARLAAIAKTISKNGGEYRFFLELYEKARGFEPVTFGRVWSDPSAHVWANSTYKLATRGVSAELERALAEFGRFVLALHLLEDKDCTLERPFSARLPLAIPGTPFSIRGDGVAAIDRLVARDLVRCTEVTHGALTLRLQPSAFPEPPARDEDQERHAPLVQKALELLAQRAPKHFRRVQETMQLLTIGPRDRETSLPGAMIAGATDDPRALAAKLIRELMRQRYCFLEETTPLFVDQPAELFAELFVSLPVTEYWFELSAIDPALSGIAQLAETAELLEKNARFSDEGSLLFRSLKAVMLVLQERIYSSPEGTQRLADRL